MKKTNKKTQLGDTIKRICEHCNMDVAIRNPSGYCDHLYHPEYCKICKSSWRLWLFKLKQKMLK